MKKSVTFGEKEEGIHYIVRPAVYMIMMNKQQQIAIIQADGDKYFLPGGGIENDETHEHCLKREAIEEMGMEVHVSAFIGYARRYFYSTKHFIYYLSEGYFYRCEAGEHVCEPIEEDHSLIWMNPEEATDKLFHEHQSWAIKEALQLF